MDQRLVHHPGMKARVSVWQQLQRCSTVSLSWLFNKQRCTFIWATDLSAGVIVRFRATSRISNTHTQRDPVDRRDAAGEGTAQAETPASCLSSRCSGGADQQRGGGACVRVVACSGVRLAAYKLQDSDGA